MKIIMLAPAALLALAACSSSQAAHTVSHTTGSSVVPCSQIASQVRKLESYQRAPGIFEVSQVTKDRATLALSLKFSTVSSRDEPLDLSQAEVAFFEFALSPTSGSGALDDLASACGLSD